MAICKDTILQVQSGTTYVDIDVISVSTPDYAVSKVEKTKLSSDGKEFEPGIEEGGNVTFTIEHSDSVFTQLTGLRGTVTGWKVLFPDDNGFGFTGFLSSLKAKADAPDKHLVLEGEITVSGVVTVI